jgi:hypothetical protein
MHVDDDSFLQSICILSRAETIRDLETSVELGDTKYNRICLKHHVLYYKKGKTGNPNKKVANPNKNCFFFLFGLSTIVKSRKSKQKNRESK